MGGSASSAVWTIAITPANTGWGTELSATWTASPGNATNATYTIYDGDQASGTILGTVVVNQSAAPVGTAQGNFQFQELGTFFPTLTANGTGTLTVVLNASSANSRVVADAVGSAKPGQAPAGQRRSNRNLRIKSPSRTPSNAQRPTWPSTPANIPA